MSLFFTLALSFTIQYQVTKTEIKMDCIERDKTHQVLTFLSVYYNKYIFNIQAMLAKTLTMNRPISNVRSKSLFLMFHILKIKHQCCLLHRSAICMWNCGSYYCLPSYEANFHSASSVHTVKFTIHFNSISNVSNFFSCNSIYPQLEKDGLNKIWMDGSTNLLNHFTITV